MLELNNQKPAANLNERVPELIGKIFSDFLLTFNSEIEKTMKKLRNTLARQKKEKHNLES